MNHRHPSTLDRTPDRIAEDAITQANQAFDNRPKLPVQCAVPAPPNYRPGMPSDQIWEWHRKLEEKPV